MRWVVVAVVAIGCGRSGFDDLEPDASPIGDPDAPAGSGVYRFGERPGAINGVTIDTYVDSEVPQNSYNYGASTSLKAEGSQAHTLLKFTVTSLSPGRTVIAARLLLYSNTSFVGGGSISPVLEDWDEGSLSGQAGAANWTMRTPSLAWSTAGAGTPGSSGAQIATFMTSGTGDFTVDLPTATVQGWIDSPSSNLGVMISASGANDLSFASSNSTTPDNSPELDVTIL